MRRRAADPEQRASVPCTSRRRCPRAAPSSHFGCRGELWAAAGRLPVDWSFAGYAAGDMPLPRVPVVGNVRDYGARGDNVTDDTGAFLRALADPKVSFACTC